MAVQLHPAHPADEFIDDLDLGDDAYAKETEWVLKSRRWFHPNETKDARRIKPPTFVIVADAEHPADAGNKIGLVSITLRKMVRDPDTAPGGRERVLSVEVMGIDRQFQGERPSWGPDRSYASHVMARLRAEAEAQRCTGLALRVREGNARAIRYYQKSGFGVVDRLQLDEGDAHLVMVAWLDETNP